MVCVSVWKEREMEAASDRIADLNKQVCVCVCVCVCMYICVCICVCMCVCYWFEGFGSIIRI